MKKQMAAELKKETCMEQIRTAVIGFGGMGSKYARMLYDGEIEGMTLAGVCCRNA